MVSKNSGTENQAKRNYYLWVQPMDSNERNEITEENPVMAMYEVKKRKGQR